MLLLRGLPLANVVVTPAIDSASCKKWGLGVSVPGMSMFGFLSEPDGVQYLQSVCILADGDDPVKLWRNASKQLGDPIANAGFPDILDIPVEFGTYLEGVQTNPRFQDTVGGLNWSFKLVEIDPLLAFQFHVFTERVESLCAAIGPEGPGRLPALLEVCLPHTVEAIPTRMTAQPNGILVESQSPNVRMLGAGVFGEDPSQRVAAGIWIGVASPLVQVIRVGGRCYLRNGFHRTYGARTAGATHIPCVFLEGTDYGQVGAAGQVFPRDLLESKNPPTLAHLAGGRAYPVTLKRVRRVISLTWAEYAIPEEN